MLGLIMLGMILSFILLIVFKGGFKRIKIKTAGIEIEGERESQSESIQPEVHDD
jgi:hypothetical protein